MSETAEKTDPALWEKVKAEITAGDKGGHAGEWSARKAQLASAEYKKKGGGYKGPKTADNHLSQWTEEEWGTKSGHDSRETGERYLPKEARKALTDEEYKRTTAKKRADTRQGKQFSAQPKDVAKMSLLPCWAMSRITRSASALSGTLSTKLVFTLSPNSFSTALRPLSWAKVQPPSPTGPT